MYDKTEMRDTTQHTAAATKQESRLSRAWNWLYKHGLTPDNKRFWGIALIIWGIANGNDTATKGGVTLIGYGDARAHISRDRDSAIDSINRAYQRAKNNNPTGGPNDKS